jgi:hypothetical protein
MINGNRLILQHNRKSKAELIDQGCDWGKEKEKQSIFSPPKPRGVP